ncbi:MAG TPA: ABC transporter substrate-binding protein [Patescibacteria group bacterium]|nr:ABC transporter substrate-binding protein [Patescibacteria group bacterium]
MLKNWLSRLGGFLKNTVGGIKLLRNLTPRQIPKIIDGLTKKDFMTLTILASVFLLSGAFIMMGNFSASEGNLPDFGGEHVEGLVGQPRFINPVLATASAVDTDLSRIIYAQLLKFDKDLNLTADLALEMPAVSPDLKTYTLKLKPNLKWQDGKPLLADDVVFTIQTIQNSEYESPLRSNWSRVKVEKIDDLTVVFTLREVSASFMTNFALGILPKHIWENLSPSNFRLSDDNLKPVGSGPFIVREIKKTPDGTIKSITLKSNDNYYQGRPYLNRVTFKFYPDYDGLLNAYQSKDINALGYLPFDKKAFLDVSDKFNQYLINLPQYQAVFFNLSKSSAVTDKSVRQALWLTTQRQQIIDDVYLGFAKPAYGPILPGNLGYNPKVAEMTHNNLDEATQILNKGGWVLDPATNTRVKNKKPLEFNLVTNNFVLNVKTAQILQEYWSKIGATIHLVIVSPSDLEQQYIRPRNFDALLFAENTGADPDPFSYWHSSQAKDPGLNFSGFSNAEADKLLTAGHQTNDVNVRNQNYQQFQLIITDAIPAVFLDSAVFVYNVPKKVKGMEFTTIIHPSERFWNIQNWYINTKQK